MQDFHDQQMAQIPVGFDPARYPGKRDGDGNLCCDAEGCWRVATVNRHGWTCTFHDAESKHSWSSITRVLASDNVRILDEALMHCLRTVHAEDRENDEWISGIQKLGLAVGISRETLARRTITSFEPKEGTRALSAVEVPETAHAFASRIRASLVDLVQAKAAKEASFIDDGYIDSTAFSRAHESAAFVIQRIASRIERRPA